MKSAFELPEKIIEEFIKNFTNGDRALRFAYTPEANNKIVTEVEHFLRSSLEAVEKEVKLETERKLAQKIYDKWNNQDVSAVSFNDWLKNYLLIKSKLSNKTETEKGVE